MKTNCWSVAALLVLLAGTLEGQVNPLSRPEGRFAVGYSKHAWETSTGRALLLEVWYPAVQSGGSRKPFATAGIERALTKQLGLAEHWASITTHTEENARGADGTHPIIVLSHGLSWPISLYQNLTEELASQGFIVVGVNHAFGAAVDFGGKTMEFQPLQLAETDSIRRRQLAQLAAVWASDIRSVLDGIVTGDALRRTTVQHLADVSKIALVGHSLGGSAAAQLTVDPRVKAVVVMEGAMRDTVATSLTVEKPLLHLIGEYNRLELENQDYRPSSTAPVFRAVIAGTGHAYFSDLIAIYKTSASPDWLVRHRYELEPSRIITITRDYTVAFLNRYLSGVDHPLLHPSTYAGRAAGPRAGGYPEVQRTIDTR